MKKLPSKAKTPIKGLISGGSDVLLYYAYQSLLFSNPLAWVGLPALFGKAATRIKLGKLEIGKLVLPIRDFDKYFSKLAITKDEKDYDSLMESTKLLPLDNRGIATENNKWPKVGSNPNQILVDNNLAWTYKKGMPWDGMEKKYWGHRPTPSTEMTVPTITVDLGKNNIDLILDSRGIVNDNTCTKIMEAEKEIRYGYEKWGKPFVYLPFGDIGNLAEKASAGAPPRAGGSAASPGPKPQLVEVKSSSTYEGPILVRFKSKELSDPNYTSADATVNHKPNQQEVVYSDFLGNVLPTSLDLMKELCAIRYNALLLKYKGGKIPEYTYSSNPALRDKNYDSKNPKKDPSWTIGKGEGCTVNTANTNIEVPAYWRWGCQELTKDLKEGISDRIKFYNNKIFEKAEKALNFTYWSSVAATLIGFVYPITYILSKTGLFPVPTEVDADIQELMIKSFVEEIQVAGYLALFACTAHSYRNQVREVIGKRDYNKTKGMGNLYCMYETG